MRLLTGLSKRALKHYKRMQYHELMAKKHKKKARYQYTILVKIFNHDDKLLQKILREYGEKHISEEE